jgi:hypothetical protein
MKHSFEMKANESNIQVLVPQEEEEAADHKLYLESPLATEYTPKSSPPLLFNSSFQLRRDRDGPQQGRGRGLRSSGDEDSTRILMPLSSFSSSNMMRMKNNKIRKLDMFSSITPTSKGSNTSDSGTHEQIKVRLIRCDKDAPLLPAIDDIIEGTTSNFNESSCWMLSPPILPQKQTLSPRGSIFHSIKRRV